MKPAAPPAASEMREIKRTDVVDRPLQVDFLYAINPDCSSVGVAAVRVIEEPGHGKLTIGKGTGFTGFPQENPRQVCNHRRSGGMVMHYQPEAGYLGSDSLTVEVVYGDGSSGKRRYAIAVNPKPAPVELTRAAAAGQEIRVGFLARINPDCASHPITNVRIVEGPEHGEATVKDDTGFTNFGKDNPRFACNTQRSDGIAVLYRGQDGYAGKDYVTVEIVYADGHETSTRYAIDVK